MRLLRRIETLAYLAVTSMVIAASCAKAEDSPLADQGGDDDDGGDNGMGGTVTGGTAGSATGGTAGKAGSTTGGSAGKGGTTSTGGQGGTTSTGGTGPNTTTYGCLDDGEGGQGGQGGASGGAPGAAGAGGSGPVTLFFDDFEDGDEAGWTSPSGDWSIVEDDTFVIQQSQSQISGNDLRVASAVNACWADQIVEARVKVVNFGGNSTSYSAGVFGRYVDSGTHYVVGMNSGSNGTLFIGKRVAGGEFQTLDDEGGYGFHNNVGTWHTLRLEIVGTSLKAYLNDTLELEATDSQITSGGVAVGTTHANARFDDVRVTAP